MSPKRGELWSINGRERLANFCPPLNFHIRRCHLTACALYNRQQANFGTCYEETSKKRKNTVVKYKPFGIAMPCWLKTIMQLLVTMQVDERQWQDMNSECCEDVEQWWAYVLICGYASGQTNKQTEGQTDITEYFAPLPGGSEYRATTDVQFAAKNDNSTDTWAAPRQWPWRVTFRSPC